MKLGYVIIRPKQKYSPNSELQRGNRLQKSKNCFSVGKVMATVFWDSHGVILIDYLQKGKTVTGTYYASLLDKLKAELVEKENSVHQDIASSYTSAVATYYGLNYLTIRLTHRI